MKKSIFKMTKRVLALACVIMLVATTVSFAVSTATPNANTITVTVDGISGSDATIMVFKDGEGPTDTETVANAVALSDGTSLSLDILKKNLRYIDQVPGTGSFDFNIPTDFPNGKYILVIGNTNEQGTLAFVDFMFSGGIGIADVTPVQISTSRSVYVPVTYSGSAASSIDKNKTVWSVKEGEAALTSKTSGTGTTDKVKVSSSSSGSLLVIPSHATLQTALTSDVFVTIAADYQRVANDLSTKREVTEKKITVKRPAKVSAASKSETSAGSGKYDLSATIDNVPDTKVKFAVKVSGGASIDIGEGSISGTTATLAGWDSKTLADGTYSLVAYATNNEDVDKNQSEAAISGNVVVSGSVAPTVVVNTASFSPAENSTWEPGSTINVKAGISGTGINSTEIFGLLELYYLDDTDKPLVGGTGVTTSVTTDASGNGILSFNYTVPRGGAHRFEVKAGLAAGSYTAIAPTATYKISPPPATAENPVTTYANGEGTLKHGRDAAGSKTFKFVGYKGNKNYYDFSYALFETVGGKKVVKESVPYTSGLDSKTFTPDINATDGIWNVIRETSTRTLYRFELTGSSAPVLP